jgi:hypothetical protein
MSHTANGAQAPSFQDHSAGELVKQLSTQVPVLVRAADVKARAAPVWEKAPDPVRRTVAQGAGRAKQHQVPLMAAAATLIAVFVTLLWWRKR